MRTPDEILIDFHAGLITRGEAVTAIAQRITTNNVAAVMSMLPPDFLEDLTRWADEWCVENRVVLSGNLRDDEAREITRRLEAARAIIEEWRAHLGDELLGSDQGVNGRQVVVDEVPLTEREAQILRHVALGLSNREIGRSLQISVETVKQQVQDVLRKIAANDRKEATVWATRRGLCASDH